ncbi:hypothetical protein Q1695_005938 [Nippostrongylus brasiliensis]|nr:hypothetical protein Q1695_005938 [Nippostrongylus brasiliensis]
MSTSTSGTVKRPAKTRFNASVLMLSSLGFAQLVAQWLITKVPLAVADAVILVLCVFSHEWNNVHGESLTRTRRAHYDVANVLETYQPRARTEGHLFQPEPPTPGDVAVVTKEGEGEGKEQEEGKGSAFMNQRDAHYAGMFTHAMKANKEMEMMNKSVAACSSLDAAQLDNVVLQPADPAKDKKEFEEKKKKQAEEYHKQFEKPFSC